MGLSAIASPFLILAAQVQAEELPAQPGANEKEIVVTGTRQEIRNELRDLFQESSNQLARIERPFCPFVIGFGDEYTPKLLELIRQNASDVGIRIAEEPCDATAVIIFIDEPHQLAQGLREKYPRIYGQMTPYSRSRLLGPERPFYAWSVTQTLDKNGGAASVSAGEAGDGNADLGAPVIRGNWSSRITSGFTKGIHTSFLIVDVNKTEGMTLGQIADFASLQVMLALQNDAWEDARMDSMLRLFDVEDPTTLPSRMGAFDRRLLEALYAIDNNAQRGSIQRGRIASYMKQDAKEVEED